MEDAAEDSRQNQAAEISDPFDAVEGEVAAEEPVAKTLDVALDLMMKGRADEDGKFIEEAGDRYANTAQVGSGRGMRNGRPLVATEKAGYSPDYVALARAREDPPFEMRGGGGKGRILDRQGKVRMESGKEIGIFGLSIGPDRNWILVEGGNGKNLVMEATTGQKLPLPLTPPGGNRLGCEWHWIGATRLLGQSGVYTVPEKGRPASGGEGHEVTQTKLYTFDVLTRQLSEVELPATVTHPVVQVTEVMGDGHFHLIHEEPKKGAVEDLGWFQIQTSETGR